MPPHEGVEIALDGEPRLLRPTLRAAVNIHRKFGSFDRCSQSIASYHLADSVFVLAEGLGTCLRARAELADQVERTGLRSLRPSLRDFLGVIAACGVRPNEGGQQARSGGKTLTHPEYFEELFKMGMGWLSWTEAETLDTPMDQILLAYQGRVAMLNVIFGGGKKTPGLVSAKDAGGVRALFQGLGGKR